MSFAHILLPVILSVLSPVVVTSPAITRDFLVPSIKGRCVACYRGYAGLNWNDEGVSAIILVTVWEKYLRDKVPVLISLSNGELLYMEGETVTRRYVEHDYEDSDLLVDIDSHDDHHSVVIVPLNEKELRELARDARKLWISPGSGSRRRFFCRRRVFERLLDDYTRHAASSLVSE